MYVTHTCTHTWIWHTCMDQTRMDDGHMCTDRAHAQPRVHRSGTHVHTHVQGSGTCVHTRAQNSYTRMDAT